MCVLRKLSWGFFFQKVGSVFKIYPILEEGNSPKVDFIGKMITDHPSIHCTLKERTVSGPAQGFNFKEE